MALIKETHKNKIFKKKPKLLFVGALVLCVAFAFIILLSRWKYTSYQVKYLDDNEHVLAYDYYAYNGEVLKAASDTASYINEKNEAYWTISYDMNEPKVDICKTSAAIYDANGNTLIVCDTKGEVTSIKTSMPILNATISENGSVAVIADDGVNVWIDYYDTDGSKISSIKTTMEATGYPFDAALSYNGVYLAVSYITYEDSQITTRIRFYDFSDKGGEKTDNVVSTYAYTGKLIPELKYIDSDICAAFSNDGVYLFKGSTEPSEYKYIEADNTIISILAENKMFGLITNGDDGETKMTIYDSKGRTKSEGTIEMAYSSLSAGEGEIVLYNRNQMAIFAENGVKKFEGQCGELIRSVVPVGNNRYVLITEEGYRLISLT